MSEKNAKKWLRVNKILDDAHIDALTQLAKITKSGELDTKELRANIAIFKNEKGEDAPSESQENMFVNLKKKLEEI